MLRQPLHKHLPHDNTTIESIMNRAKEMFSFIMQPIGFRRGHLVTKEIEENQSLKRCAI